MLIRIIGFLGMIGSIMMMSCNRPKLTNPEAGVSYALNEQRKAQFDSLSYDLTLWIPEKKADSIQGKVVVKFQLLNDELPVVFDFSQQASMVKGVRFGDQDLSYQFDNGHIIIPGQQLKKGSNELEITFIAGDLSLNRNEAYLYTLFVPDRASTCFPLLDQPNLKATYVLTLHTPVGWEAVANGSLTHKTVHAQEWVYHFAPTKPISSYLFAFAAGKFYKMSKTVSGRDITMYYRETDSIKVHRNADTVFDLHAQSLAWLEEYTGIDYPFGKFDIALIPSFQYGGMEHPGAVFYNESALFLDENATINKRLARANVIAHETAHMWFGDLVTMDWFNDVWLKEVFANFMAAKIVHPTFPEMNHELRFLLAHYPAAYEVDRSQGANPIIQNLGNLKNAGTLYGAIIYHKAPIVMRQLELKIGEKLMRESLQEYLHQYKFANARWDDLIGIIDRKSPLDMKSWSEVWVKSAGMPVYKWSHQDADINYRQAEDTLAARIWQQPLQIDVAGLGSKEELRYDLVTGQEPTWKAADKQLVYPNTDGVAYGYFPIDAISKDNFFANYTQYSDPVFRGAMLVNIWEGFLRGEGSNAQDYIKQTLQGIGKEDNPLLIDFALGTLSTTWWKFLSEPQRKVLQTTLEAQLWKWMMEAKDLGVKNTFFKRYKALAYSPEAYSRLNDIWEEKVKIPELPLSEEDKISLAYQLALLNPIDSETILRKQMSKVQNPDRKGKMQFVMPVFSADVKVRDAFFESLKKAENREKESWVLEALYFLHHPLKQETSLQYLLPSMELLQEIQLTGDIFFPTRWMDNSFAGHSSKEASDIAHAFIASHPDYPVYLLEKIYQATDMLDRAVKLRGQQ